MVQNEGGFCPGAFGRRGRSACRNGAGQCSSACADGIQKIDKAGYPPAIGDTHAAGGLGHREGQRIVAFGNGVVGDVGFQLEIGKPGIDGDHAVIGNG